MERTRIYCEMDFYIEFCENQPRVAQFEDVDYWRILFSFLLKKGSEIYLNISLAEFLKDKDKFPFSDYLINDLWPAKLLRFDSESINGFPDTTNIEKYIHEDKEFSQSFFLLAQSNDICDSLENDYGLMILHKENLKERCDLLFENFIQPVEKGSITIKDWGFINKLSHPCNSLMIFDNYINKEKEVNLFELLTYLLPESLKIPFHITISTLKEEKGVKTNHKVLQEKTSKHIKKIRPQLDFRLCVLAHDNTQVHDRNLLTNYLWLNAPAGFDLFTKNLKDEILTQHTTSIFGYFPTSNQESALVSRSLLNKSFKSVYSKAVNTEYLKDFWGVKENRLLD